LHIEGARRDIAPAIILLLLMNYPRARTLVNDDIVSLVILLLKMQSFTNTKSSIDIRIEGSHLDITTVVVILLLVRCARWALRATMILFLWVLLFYICHLLSKRIGEPLLFGLEFFWYLEL
jgi:hypothetical protein